MDAPRNAQQRKDDTMARLASDVGAWREVNELDGRALLRDGRWLS